MSGDHRGEARDDGGPHAGGARMQEVGARQVRWETSWRGSPRRSPWRWRRGRAPRAPGCASRSKLASFLHQVVVLQQDRACAPQPSRP
jgi:hypothetical protein